MERLAEEEASAFIPQLRERAKSKPSQSLRLETPATALPRREILVAIFSNIFFFTLDFLSFHQHDFNLAEKSTCKTM